ncbi:MAG: hypothetical protein K6G83_14815 [Lachnospiraceae bacterium]|nr:hypothetical protein [Lachnospiraceae bacterium]
MEKKSKKPLIIVLIILGVVVLGIVGLFILGSGDDGEEKLAAQTEEAAAEPADAATEADTVSKEGTFTKKSGSLGGSSSQNGGETWTVMVYMCGTDLESANAFATINLAEMLDAEKSDQVNILVETGGTKEWTINEFTDEFKEFKGIDPKSLSYYHVVEEDLILENTLPLASMGDPDTLRDFIVWGSEVYPADKYMLIFWDHGGGSVFGVCIDELHNGDTLTLAEIKEAVSGADVPLEAVGFDACLMASLETAEALQGYGHYMIASQEVEPGTGWSYDNFLSYLSQNPDTDGLALGKQIADSYMNKCKEYETDELATLSVTDLTRIPALSAVYKSYSGEFLLSAQDTSDFQAVSQGAVRAENYGGNTDSEGYTDMVDLGDLVAQTGSILSMNAANVTGALRDAVCYEVHGENRANSNGLSVFYPLYIDDDVIGLYADTTDNTAFIEFASIMNGDWDSAEWEKAWEEAYATPQSTEGKYDELFNNGESVITEYVPEEGGGFFESISNLQPIQKEDYKLEFEQSFDEDGFLQIEVTSGLDILQDVSFELYYEEPDTGEYLYMGSDNNLYGDYETGIFTDNFEGAWMTVGDEFVYAELIEQNEDYNLYTIPILLNGEEMNLRAVYDYDEEAYSILGVNEGIDPETGQSGRDIKQLKNGDKVEFLFDLYDPETDEEEMIPIGEITWSSDTIMEDTYMDDDRFLYMFKLEDIFGDVYYSDAVYMEIADGEIYAYEP